MTVRSSDFEALGFTGWAEPGGYDAADGVWYVDRNVVNNFPEAGVDVFGDVDASSFWFDHRNAVISRLIEQCGTPGTFLEVGSGSGVVAAHLVSRGLTVGCVEPIRSGAIQAAARGVKASMCGDLASLAIPTGVVPNIGMFDVIEHLDEPQELLRECRRVLRDDGTLFVTVPAHQWLWSDFDEWNGHVRRYSKKSLRAEIELAGFDVVEASYFFFPLLAPAVISRLVLRRFAKKRTDSEIEHDLAAELSPQSSLIDRLVRAAHFFEVPLIGRVGLPSGTSLVLAAKLMS